MRLILFLMVIAIAIPVAAYTVLPIGAPDSSERQIFHGGTSYPASELPFEFHNVGPDPVWLPQITNVQIIDFDGDGANEIIACDSLKNSILMFEPENDRSWRETTLIEDVSVPAHATVVDLDGDGDNDVIASVLGNIMPDDSVIGRVELFENVDGTFVRHVLLDDVRRIADVQPGDFDGDGDLDLAVAEFGYSRGSVLWLENRGEFQFRDHRLLLGPGTIHVPVADYDGDGDLDIAAIMTQHEEELWAFENDGTGQFTPRRLWFTVNQDLGSAGLITADLDSDGDLDFVLPAGDNLEDYDAYPQPYHGCYWFENLGDWQFEPHRISDLGGTYAAAVGDMNLDGHQDVVLVSLTNNYLQPDNASVIWLENDGNQSFQPWQVAHTPLQLVTVAVGDLDADGRPDIVAGSLNVRKPHRDTGRVSAWYNEGEK